MATEHEHIISPEWLVAQRADIKLDKSVLGGGDISPAPLMRGAAFTDFGQHEIAVPFGDTEAERAVRLHELIHSRISPTTVPATLLDQLGVTRNSVRIAEEMRVNIYGAIVEGENPALGRISKLADGTEPALAKSIVDRNSWPDALNLFLTTMNTDVHKQVKRKLRTVPEWKEAFTEIERILSDDNMDFKAIDYFRSCKNRYKSTEPQQFVWIDPRTKTKEKTVMGEGFVEYTLPIAERIDQWTHEPPQKRGKKKKSVDPYDLEKHERKAIKQSDDWEMLRFGMTSLTETTSTFIGKRKRPAMTGKFPVRPDRLLTDPERRIFRETVRSGGGVVVFDCSGSMSVSHEDIHNCVKQFQGATIVAYTHRGANKANAWVLAKNGRMISETEFRELDLNHGNGVDGPVLRWALRQRRTPKDFVVWVSDGAVTGKHDQMDRHLIEECAQLSVRNNIIGVEDSDKAIELLANMKRTGAMPKNTFCGLITQALKGNI